MFFFSFEFSPESQQPICKWDLFSHGVLVQVRFYFSWGLGVSEIFSSHCLDGTGSNSHLHYIWITFNISIPYLRFLFFYVIFFTVIGGEKQTDRRGKGSSYLFYLYRWPKVFPANFFSPSLLGGKARCLTGSGSDSMIPNSSWFLLDFFYITINNSNMEYC